MLKESDQVYLPGSRVAFRKIDDQMVLVHTVENRLITLNETGTAIWERLDGRSVESIAREIEALFEIGFEQALADTLEFLQGLCEKGLVQLGSDGAAG